VYPEVTIHISSVNRWRSGDKLLALYIRKFIIQKHSHFHIILINLLGYIIWENTYHKSLEMTLRYAHLASGHKMKAVNILDKVLTKQHVKNMQLDKNLTISRKNESSTPTTSPKSLYDNMGDTGFEPVTPCLSSKCKQI